VSTLTRNPLARPVCPACGDLLHHHPLLGLYCDRDVCPNYECNICGRCYEDLHDGPCMCSCERNPCALDDDGLPYSRCDECMSDAYDAWIEERLDR